MNNNYEGAPRYSLIIETKDNHQYYYDKEQNCFVLFNKNDKEEKTSLSKIDAITSLFHDKEEFAMYYGINNQISSIFIKYNFKGDNYLAPVFNNREWNHIANSYNGKYIDFKDPDNLMALNRVYYELLNPSSSFHDYIIKNPSRKVKICDKTNNLIVSLVVHERAIRSKKENLGYFVDDIYKKDRTGFYTDFRKRMSLSYRDFRSIYLNYCYFKNKTGDMNIEFGTDEQKKVLIRPVQISMFD